MEYASEIHELLKLGDNEASHDSNLPGAHIDPHSQDLPTELPTAPVVGHAIPAPHLTMPSDISVEQPKKIRLRSLIVYPVVFAGAFLFFYVVLNFSSLYAQIQGFFTKPQTQQQTGTQDAAYNAWIRSYFFGVNDPSLLDPNSDDDHDGLSNYDEFVMGTNPIVADTDHDGYADGLEVLTGHNPWGSGEMTSAQKQLASNIDLNLVSDRLAFNAAPKNGTVAGTSITNYDLTKPGKISIPRLNLQAPLIWSQDPSTFETDLTHGVIHYPGTSMPGQTGVMYVSGHSSDYIWKHDAFAQIFTKLNYLKPGDDIFIDVYGLDGKDYTYRYQVTKTTVYTPTDQAQFIDNSGNILNLSTCWPIGSTASRLVVSATQVSL